MSALKNSATKNKLGKLLTTTTMAAAGLVMMNAGQARADNWTDHEAIVGGITIDTSVANTTNISQHDHFVKVRGDGDINAGWTVNVAQPGSNAKYVLYDIEGDATQIMGNLNANGEIFIFDQNGIIFGQNSQVNVGALIASTGSIADSDILDNDGKFTFNGVDGDGAIELNGSVTVAEAGLAAFVAPTVVNNGLISAKLGKVALASGNKVTLDLYGDNLVEIAVEDKALSGLVENNGSVVAEGGTVVMAAQTAKDAVDNVINMNGIVDVSSVTVQGGKIILSGGKKGKVSVAGTAKADGKTGGGTIDVRGQNIEVAETALLSADATENGNGGTNIVFADNLAIINGRMTARGGLLGGNGGFIETSGYELGVSDTASVDASAVNGLGGLWLLDPLSIVITNEGSGTTFALDGRDYRRVAASAITTALTTGASGTNVTVQTGAAGSFGSTASTLDGGLTRPDNNEGDIRVRSSITHSGAGNNTLTLLAHDDIVIENNAVISATGAGQLNVVLNAQGLSGNVPTILGPVWMPRDGDIELRSGSSIITKGGYIDFDAGSDIVIDGTIDTAGGNVDLSALGTGEANILGVGLGAGTASGNITINGSITTGASLGLVNLTADDNITVNGTVTTGGGFGATAKKNVTVNGTVSSTNATKSIHLKSLQGDVASLLGGGSGIIINSGGALTSNGGLIKLESLGATIVEDPITHSTIHVGNVAVKGTGIVNAGAGEVRVEAIGVADLGGTITSGALNAQSDANINFTGTVNADYVVSATAKKDITVSGKINTTGDNVFLQALGTGVSKLAGVTFPTGKITIDTNGEINTFGGKIRLDAQGPDALDPLLGTTMVSYGNIEAKAGSKLNTLGGELDLDAKGNINLNGTINAGVFNANADGNINLNGTTNTQGDINVVAKKDVGVGGFVDSQGNHITLTALGTSVNKVLGYDIPTGGITIGNGASLLSSGGNIALNAEGAAVPLSSLGFLTALGADLSSVDFINLNFGNVFINGSGNVDAQGGNIDINNNGILKAAENSIRTTGIGTINLEQNSGLGFSGLSAVIPSLTDLVALGSIQNAVDALQNSGSGLNTIEVGAGAYLENVQVNENNVFLKGAKAGIATDHSSRDIITMLTTDPLLILGSESLVGLGGVNAFNITGTNVTLDGFTLGGTTGAAVEVGGAGNNAIIQNNIIGLAQDGIRVSSVDNAQVRDNLIVGVGGTGIELLGTTNAKVTGNDIVGVLGTHGIGAFGGGGLLVDSNVIGGVVGDALHLEGVDKADIQYNTVVLAGGNGIYVGANKGAQSKNITVYDNDVLAAVAGDGIALSDVDTANIELNTILLAGNHGISVTATTAPSFGTPTESNNITVHDNDVLGVVNGNGIDLRNTTNGYITDNFVAGVLAGHGTYVDPSFNIWITGNVYTAHALDGIHAFDTVGLHILNNQVYASGDDGISVATSAGVEVGGNIVLGAGLLSGTGDGIKLDQTLLSATYGNLVGLVADNGIEITNSGLALVAGNAVGLTGGNGIYANNTVGLGVIGNLVGLTANDGISVNNTLGFLVNGNIVGVTGGNGINLNTVALGEVSGNLVALTAKDGIHGEILAGVSINNNLVTLTGENGISVDGGVGVDISDNIVALTTLDGIKARNVLGLNVSGNVVALAGDDGIDIGNTLFTNVEDNLVTLVANDGIKVTNTAVLNVDGNIVVGAGDDGVDLHNVALANVSDNWVVGAGDNGIEGSNLLLTNFDGNTIIGVGNDGLNLRNAIGLNVVGNAVLLAGNDGIDIDNAIGANVQGNLIGVVGNDGISVRNALGLNVSQNLVLVAGHNGIDLDNVALANVSQNVVGIVGNDGINVRNAVLLNVEDNLVGIAGDDGIDIDNAILANVEGNIVGIVGDDGITTRNTIGLNVEDNVVVLAGDDGIDIENALFTNVEGNVVALAGDDGISLRNTAFTLVNDNTVVAAGDDGIELTNGLLTAIVNNRVFLTGDDGIATTNTLGSLIAGNTIVGVLDDGIDVHNGIGVLIADNNVLFAGDNGIEASNAVGLAVVGNRVGFVGGNGIDARNVIGGLYAGNLVAFAGNDGIHLEDNLGALVALNAVGFAGDDGIDIDDSNAVAVVGNAVGLVGNNGIEVSDTDNLAIGFNVIGLAGNDGINVRRGDNVIIGANLIGLTGGDGIDLRSMTDTTVIGNLIGFTGGHGIRARNSDDLTIRDNVIAFALRDGINVAGTNDLEIDNNTIAFVLDDGVDVRGSSNVVISDNNIAFTGDDGIYVNPSSNVVIRGNTINFAGNNGIHLRGNTDVQVLSNVISNSGNRGLYVSGQNNGLVVLKGNTFNNNPIGAEFESGQIDLTATGADVNTFNGGSVALKFDPTVGGDPLKLSLVGDTIGETVFNGQSTYYVELANGAFFAPGNPTIIDGYHATYDGFRPDTVPYLTQAQYDALEAKIQHFNDLNSLGLFFFGQVPDIAEEDIFRNINAFNPGPGGLNLTITGLPMIPGFAGSVGNFLNSIAPAAGGNGAQGAQAQPQRFSSLVEQLASIAPAAGGDSNTGTDAPDTNAPSVGSSACWGDALAAAGAGTIVNMSYDGSPDMTLNAAASCQSGI